MTPLKTTVTAIALSIMSLAATAEPLTHSANEAVRNKSKVIEVLVSDSKQEAYQAALQKLNTLVKSEPRSLSNDLHLAGSNDIDLATLHLKAGNYVTVSERMKLDGNIQYIGLVHVNFHYLEDKSRD